MKTIDGNGVHNLQNVVDRLESIKWDLKECYEAYFNGLEKLKPKLIENMNDLNDTRIDYFDVISEDLSGCDSKESKIIKLFKQGMFGAYAVDMLLVKELVETINNINNVIKAHADEINEIDKGVQHV